MRPSSADSGDQASTNSPAVPSQPDHPVLSTCVAGSVQRSRYEATSTRRAAQSERRRTRMGPAGVLLPPPRTHLSPRDRREAHGPPMTRRVTASSCCDTDRALATASFPTRHWASAGAPRWPRPTGRNDARCTGCHGIRGTRATRCHQACARVGPGPRHSSEVWGSHSESWVSRPRRYAAPGCPVYTNGFVWGDRCGISPTVVDGGQGGLVARSRAGQPRVARGGRGRSRAAPAPW